MRKSPFSAKIVSCPLIASHASAEKQSVFR